MTATLSPFTCTVVGVSFLKCGCLPPLGSASATALGHRDTNCQGLTKTQCTARPATAFWVAFEFSRDNKLPITAAADHEKLLTPIMKQH